MVRDCWGGVRRETRDAGGVDDKGHKEALSVIVMDVYRLDCGMIL